MNIFIQVFASLFIACCVFSSFETLTLYYSFLASLMRKASTFSCRYRASFIQQGPRHKGCKRLHSSFALPPSRLYLCKPLSNKFAFNIRTVKYFTTFVYFGNVYCLRIRSPVYIDKDLWSLKRSMTLTVPSDTKVQ